MYSRPMFWFLNIIIPVACIAFDTTIMYWTRMYMATPDVVLRERESLKLNSTIDKIKDVMG